MKKLSTVLFIVVVLSVTIGVIQYSQVTKQSGITPGPSLSTNENQTSTNQTTTSPEALQSPIPTVTQIPLTITSPANNSSLTSPTLIIKGITSPKADIFVNDSQVIADAQGNFTVQVTLDEGENFLVITANDAAGNYSEQDVSVVYNSGQ
jgi:hypothetical protein